MVPKTTTAIFTTSTTIMSLTPPQRTRTRLFSNQSLPKVPPRQPGSRSKAFFFALLSFSFPSLVRPSSGRRRRGGCVLSAEERRCGGRGRGGALAEEQPRGRNLSFLFLHPSLTSPCQPFLFLPSQLMEKHPKTSQIPLSRKIGAVLVGATANSHSRAMTAAVGTGGTF